MEYISFYAKIWKSKLNNIVDHLISFLFLLQYYYYYYVLFLIFFSIFFFLIWHYIIWKAIIKLLIKVLYSSRRLQFIHNQLKFGNFLAEQTSWNVKRKVFIILYVCVCRNRKKIVTFSFYNKFFPQFVHFFFPSSTSSSSINYSTTLKSRDRLLRFIKLL